MATYEQTLQTLYRVPLPAFVAERTRLAAALRAGGDESGARQLAKRRRPTISAWAVNQLYWRAREAFDEMLDAAERVRGGDLAATTAYRRAIATLRQRAASVLQDAGQAAPDAVLGRVATTLAAIAAAGFDPDAPGTLARDRESVGFEVAVAPGRPRSDRPARALQLVRRDAKAREASAARARAVQEEERRAAERAQRKAREVERARRTAERRRVEQELRAARAASDRRERALTLRRQELGAAEKAADAARDAVRDLERALRDLEDGR